MSTPHGAGPSGNAWRVGDAEREAAVEALGEHFSLGRLDREEYDERSERAYAAKTDRDLVGLFGDLPLPHGQVVATTGAQRPDGPDRPDRVRRGPHPAFAGGRRRGFPLAPLFFVAFVIACVTHAFWLLFLVPMFVWCVVRPVRRWHHPAGRGW